jgi:phosphoribosylanthranilate isomerase
MLVKVCGLTRIEDALASCDAGADLAGFVFVRQSPRFIEPGKAREIVQALPEAVGKVGVFAGAGPDEIRAIAALAGITHVQLHGPFDIPDPELAEGLGVSTIRALRVGSAADLAGAEEIPADLLLLDARLDGALGGTGRTFDWSLARTLCVRRKVIVAGGLTPGNVGQAVRLLHPHGVDVSSGVESSPGVKDHGKMREFIRAARAAAAKRR